MSGHGDSLGAALMAHLMAAAGGARRSSFTAKGWHAQLAALTKNSRGMEAAEAVGLTATRRTLLAWLAESQTPSPANRTKIGEAYDRLAAKFPRAAAQATLEISGLVEIDGKTRDRGHGRAGLKVNGSRGNWERIEALWDAGELTDDELEDLYAEDVIKEDIAFSDPPGFPGTSYSVV